MRARFVRIGVLLFGTVVALAGVMVGLSSATADSIEDPVTDLRIREVDRSPEGLSVWSHFRLDLSWSVPDSTQAGDTFVLTLPRQVIARAGRFELTSPSGDVVAHARATDREVTFTMTRFVDTHRQVEGTAYFEAGFVLDAIVPGETNELVFSTESRDFVIPVDVAAEATDNTEPRKYGYWNDAVDQGVTEPQEALTWRVVSALGPLQTVALDDRIGPGHELDCETVDVRLLTQFAANGDVIDSEPLDADLYTVDSCDADGLRLTALGVPTGDAVAVTYRSSVSDATSKAYKNEATLLQDGDTIDLSSDVARSKAGGIGTGLAGSSQLAEPIAATATPEPAGAQNLPAPENSTGTTVSGLPDAGSSSLSLTLAGLGTAALVAGVALLTLAVRRRQRT